MFRRLVCAGVRMQSLGEEMNGDRNRGSEYKTLLQKGWWSKEKKVR